MILYSVLLLILVFLLYFHKGLRFTLILYVLVSTVFIIYINSIPNLSSLEWYEKWAIWLTIIPYMLLSIMLFIITIYIDICRKK